jgi:hypothetical protein
LFGFMPSQRAISICRTLRQQVFLAFVHASSRCARPFFGMSVPSLLRLSSSNDDVATSWTPCERVPPVGASDSSTFDTWDESCRAVHLWPRYRHFDRDSGTVIRLYHHEDSNRS